MPASRLSRAVAGALAALALTFTSVAVGTATAPPAAADEWANYPTTVTAKLLYRIGAGGGSAYTITVTPVSNGRPLGVYKSVGGVLKRIDTWYATGSSFSKTVTLSPGQYYLQAWDWNLPRNGKAKVQNARPGSVAFKVS